MFVVNSNGERDTRIDNKANEDVDALLSGNQTKYSRYVPSQSLSNSYIAVPTFSGNMSNWDFEKRVQETLPSFSFVHYSGVVFCIFYSSSYYQI